MKTWNIIRERTLHEFSHRIKGWLYKEKGWDGCPSNNYLIWFHAFKDEINHRGQIRWLRKRLTVREGEMK